MTPYQSKLAADKILRKSMDARRRGESGEIVLVYVGENPDNVSGWSSKFWMLHPPPAGGGGWVARWGKLGSKGQRSLVKPRGSGLADALRTKIAAKLLKGYTVAEQADVAAPDRARRRPLAALVQAASWTATPIEAAIATLAARSASKLHVAHGVQLWVTPDNHLIGTRRSGAGVEIASLGLRAR